MTEEVANGRGKLPPPMTDETKLKRYDDLVDTVEELHDEGMLLRQAIKQTLDENSHLADGENCTLIVLKRALRAVGTPWAGDELHNAIGKQTDDSAAGGRSA